MKPAQKLLLSCRQTSEAGSRLVDWFEANPNLLGVGRDAVCEDIDALTARLIPLARAAETMPGIGLLATSGGGKTDLLFALLATRASTTLGEFGQRPLDAETIRGLLPDDGEAGGCVVVRYSAAELPPAPRGYPIRVGLLSMIDIAAIMTRAAHSTAPTKESPPSPGEIAALFGSVAGQLSPQAVPGLSERDVLDLRETLNAILPGHPALATLAAGRYWEQFREIAPHTADRDRRRLLAVLWHGEPTYTALFNRLCDGLDRLGHGAEAYCPPEALLGKDKSTGWMTRHPRNIFHASTLLMLDQTGGPVLNVMNRYGQAVDVERAVIAALVAELPLHIGASRLNDFAPAEILDFPVPPPIDGHRPRPGSSTATQAANDDLAFAAARFARAKAIYLFERACVRRDVTCLLVAANPAFEDDTYTAAIGDWVETAQGATAHARERVRRGLFLAAALPLREPGADQMAALIRNVIGRDQEWPLAWTPNRPLTDVFWFQTGDSSGASRTAAVSSSTALAPAQSGSAQAVLLQDDTVVQLVRALVLASDAHTKQLQLTQALSEIRRRLRGTVLRHHSSNDPAALSDWRRGTAVVVQHRLQYIIGAKRLGHLLRALLPAEADLAAAILAASSPGSAAQIGAGLQVAWPRDSQAAAAGETVPAGSSAALPAGGPARATRMAEAAVAHWLKEMRRAARSPRLCRDLRIEPAILQNLIDELQIGALRTSLAGEIAGAFTRSGNQANLLDASKADVASLAAYACRIINAYLEVLGTPPHRGRNGSPRSQRSASSEGEVADISADGYSSPTARARGGPRRNSRPALDQWEISFANLVEDNIAAALPLAGHGDKDRELGELIALFASGPFEVEP